jgi:hypothetical protein
MDGKDKGKIVLVHSLRAYGGSADISAILFYLETRKR